MQMVAIEHIQSASLYGSHESDRPLGVKDTAPSSTGCRRMPVSAGPTPHLRSHRTNSERNLDHPA